MRGDCVVFVGYDGTVVVLEGEGGLGFATGI